jgi:hypothetical protein
MTASGLNLRCRGHFLTNDSSDRQAEGHASGILDLREIDFFVLWSPRETGLRAPSFKAIVREAGL